MVICMYNIIMLMYYNMYTMLHLATKVFFFFYWEIVGYGMSVGGHSVARWWKAVVIMDKQISYMTLIGVYSTMHPSIIM